MNKQNRISMLDVDGIVRAIQATQTDPGKKGRAFQVRFYKVNGELRTMRARLGMRRGLTGKGLSFDPARKHLKPVWELGNGYRMVPLLRLVSLRLPDGKKHLKEVLTSCVS